VVRVSIEIRCGAARFTVGVQAESIQRAVSLVEGSHSASDVRVILPIAPDGIFVEDVAVQGKQTEFEEPQKKTAA
jgi:hypothetical protein